MSASASEPPAAEKAVPLEEAPFVENDHAMTRLPFDKGRIPFYVAIVWVCFIVIYVTALALLLLPDLRAWWVR